MTVFQIIGWWLELNLFVLLWIALPFLLRARAHHAAFKYWIKTHPHCPLESMPGDLAKHHFQ